MALHVHTEIEIKASAKKVWDALTNFAEWSEWNPSIPSVKGTPQINETLQIVLKLGGKAVKATPTVLAATPKQELRWRGGLPIPGLFVGEHYFKIEPINKSKVRFIQGEDFEGALIPILFRNPKTIERAYQRSNENLKRLIETGVGVPKMKAAVIHKYGATNDVLDVTQVPIPEVRDNDLLIEVHSASVNPLDFKIRKGALKLILNKHFPKVMGHDVSGVVAKVGKNVTGFRKGDEVFSRVDTRRFGTFAEYCVAEAQNVAKKPKNISHSEAASIPLVALTTWQAFVEQLKLQKGQKVLIQAGSGGIGTVAIQIAKHLGAEVATTTSTKNVQLVKDLGADVVVDYRKEQFEDVLSGYDGVYDTMGGDILEKGFQVLKKGGTLTTIVANPSHQWAKDQGLPLPAQAFLYVANLKTNQLAKKLGVHYAPFLMRADGAQLKEIAKLLQKGKIKPIIDQTFSLDQIKAALDYSESGRARGKIVITVKE